MKEENFNQQMLRFTRGRRQHGENESERADAVMGLQSEEWQLSVDVV